MISLLHFCVHVFANKITPRVVDELCAHFLSWYAMSSAKIGQILSSASARSKICTALMPWEKKIRSTIQHTQVLPHVCGSNVLHVRASVSFLHSYYLFLFLLILTSLRYQCDVLLVSLSSVHSTRYDWSQLVELSRIRRYEHSYNATRLISAELNSDQYIDQWRAWREPCTVIMQTIKLHMVKWRLLERLPNEAQMAVNRGRIPRAGSGSWEGQQARTSPDTGSGQGRVYGGGAPPPPSLSPP